jgi:5-methylcytosine-specific restriction endonuclease McrA
MRGKRRHAIYCDRDCKGAASELRREADGRAKARYAARYQRTAEQCKLQAIENYHKNIERERERSRQWRANNPEARALQHLRRKARLACCDHRRVTPGEWLAVVRHYGDCCAYCGARGKVVRDHVIPIVRGGRHAIGNLLPACVTCNSSKSGLLLIEWRRRKLKGGESLFHPFRQ